MPKPSTLLILAAFWRSRARGEGGGGVGVRERKAERDNTERITVRDKIMSESSITAEKTRHKH